MCSLLPYKLVLKEFHCHQHAEGVLDARASEVLPSKAELSLSSCRKALRKGAPKQLPSYLPIIEIPSRRKPQLLR